MRGKNPAHPVSPQECVIQLLRRTGEHGRRFPWNPDRPAMRPERRKSRVPQDVHRRATRGGGHLLDHHCPGARSRTPGFHGKRGPQEEKCQPAHARGAWPCPHPPVSFGFTRNPLQSSGDLSVSPERDGATSIQRNEGLDSLRLRPGAGIPGGDPASARVARGTAWIRCHPLVHEALRQDALGALRRTCSSYPYTRFPVERLASEHASRRRCSSWRCFTRNLRRP